jgi:hypothetical protein
MLFPLLLIAVTLVAVIGIAIALDGSRDVFHPLVFTGPMMAFLYGWMPWKLYSEHGLDRFFDSDQIIFVATLNLVGVTAFVLCGLSAGVRLPKQRRESQPGLTQRQLRRLLVGGCIAGGIGFVCWAITIINVGGFVNAYSTSYTGGWDDSGYIRDGSILLLVGLLIAVFARSSGGPSVPSYLMIATFGLPWLAGALLMARRGPTFELVVVLLMGWYINRKKRPPLIVVGVAGLCLGWLVLFLVTNRSSIYLGSDFDVKTDVSNIVQAQDTGNEWIYGAGTVLSAQHRNHYFWMRRYLAQILVRPIPSAVWPTKYEDFGIPELLHNAGTGEGFGDALGWKGADGSAPGIVADLWAEVWWFAPVLMGLLGWVYGFVWRRAVLRGGAWASQFVLIAALSIYLVMQTMEAVIFRTLLLSIPCWLVWRYAMAPVMRRSFYPGRQTEPVDVRGDFAPRS